MSTLKDVRSAMAILLGDPDEDWVTPEYADPMINLAYTTQNLYLLSTCQPFITKVVEITGDPTDPPPNPVKGIPQGTTDLSPWQAKNMPWEGLIKPLKLEWKQAGQPENYYDEAVRKEPLPNVAPPGNNGAFASMYYELRAYKLYCTPLSMLVDLRLRGDFKPGRLRLDTDEIIGHPMMETALAYGAAALGGVERVNATYITQWGQLAEATLDDVAADMIRSGQGVRSRLGRNNRRSYSGRV